MLYPIELRVPTAPVYRVFSSRQYAGPTVGLDGRTRLFLGYWGNFRRLKLNEPGADRDMMMPASVLSYVRAQPFRPFRIHMASGKSFDVRHPEMVRVGRTNVLVFSFVSDQPEVFDEWQSVSLMLMETISDLEAPVSS